MTTLHVRLPIVVDKEHSERCSSQCPSSGNMEFCHAFKVYRLRRNGRNEGLCRDAACLSATESDALSEKVVEAAKGWAEDGPTDWNFATDKSLFEAVDALRANESKGGNDGT